MVLKKCYYIEWDNKYRPKRFGWRLTLSDSPACKCIMAVAEGRTVSMDELNKLQVREIISDKEHKAILNFDARYGTMNDLKTIEKLAEKVKVKLVRK